MKATALEYRFRYALHGLIYALGFLAPWERFTRLNLGGSTAWIALTAILSRAGILSFGAATQLLLILACIAAVVAVFFRLTGTAWLGAGIVQSGSLHGNALLADGPFRYTRNPLYLGTFCNTLALALIMPPSGALLSIILVSILLLRLIGAEESFLPTRLGPAYAAYCAAVPRLLPSLRPRVPSAGVRPRWGTALLSEVFVVGTAMVYLAFGFQYNADPMLKGVLIAFGASLIARALLPREPGHAAQPAA